MTRRKRAREVSPKAASRSSQPVAPTEPGRPDWLLACISTVYALALLVVGAHPRSLLWGLDLLGYLPGGERLGLTALLFASVAFIWMAAARPGSWRPRLRARAIWLLASLGPLAAFFWVLRDRVHLLGDGLTWIEIVKEGSRPLYSEPLAAVAISGVASLNRAAPTTPLTVLSIACGLVVAVLYYGIARELAPPGAPRAIATGLFLTLGCNQLYFGYIESYPIASVAILLYLWVLLRCLAGRLPLAVAALALAVAIGSHFVAVFLVPSFIFLVVRARESWVRSTILLGLPAVVAVGTLAVLHYPFTAILEPIHFIAGGRAGMTEWLASALHRIPHLLNLCFLIAPIPLLLILARLVHERSEPGKTDSKTMALLVAALPGLLAAVALSLFVFPGHDWDLITMTLLPGIVLAVTMGAEYLVSVPGLAAAGVIGLGAAGLLAFGLVNANESSAVRRYDALLAPDIPLTPHERAYGNERLVKVYTARKNPELALLYAQRAVDSDPANDRYWAMWDPRCTT